MKFARRFAVVSLISASLPLAIACGSASNSDLFSPTGSAGMSAGHTAGVSNGGGATDEGGSPGISTGGALSGGGDTSDNGSGGDATAGAATGGGNDMGGASGGAAMAGAGGSMAGAGGSMAGSGGSTAGAGGSMAGAGGSMAGAGGSMAGAGGASMCPPAAPKADQFCAVSTPDSCFYGGQACSCLPANSGGGQFKRWGCYGTPAICPDTKPAAGLTCKFNIGAECPYSASEYCVCMGNNNEAHWACQAPGATCAAQKPQTGDACGTIRVCDYADDACFCNGSKWACEGG